MPSSFPNKKYSIATISTLIASYYLYLLITPLILGWAVYKIYRKDEGKKDVKEILEKIEGLSLSKRPPGLSNSGNTCFVNSVLQVNIF